MLRQQRTLKVNQDDGILWIASGKVFPFPLEARYLFPQKLNTKKPVAHLKLVSPSNGVVKIENNFLTIHQNNLSEFIKFDCSIFTKSIENCNVELSLVVKNYQYIDKHTVLGFLNFYPKANAKIYAIRKKEAKYITTFLLITEDDIWKINSDHVNNFAFFKEKKSIVRAGNILNTNSKFSRSGYFLKRDGFKMIFQDATPIFLSRGTILNYKQGDFVLEKKIFATLVNYIQQTEDIVQGLPKIEELIEARKPKVKCSLAKSPGILLPEKFLPVNKQHFDKNVINIFVDPKIKKTDFEKLRKKYKITPEEQIVIISNSLQARNNIFLYKKEFFKPLSLINSGNFSEFTYKQGLLKVDLDDSPSQDSTKIISKYHFGNVTLWETIKKPSYMPGGLKVGKKVKTLKKKRKFFYKNSLKSNEASVFFESLEPSTKYILPIYSKVLFEPGNFIDLGEPITEGIIDVHELLNILFEYHSKLDGVKVGTIRSLQKFQLLLVNSIQSIYQSQGVNISSKHIEIIVRQMTSKVTVKNSGDTPLLEGELIRLSLMNEIYDALKNVPESVIYKTPNYEPTLMSATNSSLNKDGFLSAAGFQETKRIIAKAAIEGSTDWLRGLKECIIVGRLIPAGSTFLNYKHYLDTIFFFKEKKEN